MAKQKERLDKLLTDRGLVESRTRAQALIMAGKVKVEGTPVLKAGTPVGVLSHVEVESGERWASRGAAKLLKGLDVFNLDVLGCVCIDIGASTGGFTDVLLSKGAQKVYSVDVGYGQLLWRLACDPRVIVMDRTNARTLTSSAFNETPDLVVCDASFISLKLLLPAFDAILPSDGQAVLLIKPQFEAGRERLGRGGVVRDAAIHEAVIRELLEFIKAETKLYTAGLSWSPILGPEGNMEFLLYLNRREQPHPDIQELVAAAHRELIVRA